MFKVILIDDEEIIRRGLRKMVNWKKMGCEVVAEAEDGIQGFELIKEHVPDIIISDIRMPKKNGLEMIAAMKDINQDCQIIILTGFREFEYAQEAIRLGVLQFLLKPSKIKEIMAAVEEAVEILKIQEKEEEEYKHIRKRIKDYYLDDEDLIEDDLIFGSKKTSDKDEMDRPQFIAAEAVKYMKRNYKEKLTLQMVSDYLGVSTWHMCKVLKKETGSSFIDLLNGIRVEEAKKLLVTTRLKVYEICEEVGYLDTAYFSKLFKRFAEKTPNEYRNTQYRTTNNKIDSF